MTKQEKLLKKFLENPTSLNYSQIENFFSEEKYLIEQRKGSHKKISLKNNEQLYCIIPIHGGDCKPVYKIKLKKFYLQSN